MHVICICIILHLSYQHRFVEDRVSAVIISMQMRLVECGPRKHRVFIVRARNHVPYAYLCVMFPMFAVYLIAFVSTCD